MIVKFSEIDDYCCPAVGGYVGITVGMPADLVNVIAAERLPV